MTRRRDPTVSDEEPLGKGWKQHWREKERGKTLEEKQRIRLERREERRRLHKKSRRVAKQKIEDEHAE